VPGHAPALQRVEDFASFLIENDFLLDLTALRPVMLAGILWIVRD
jgi:hypothetical protein